MDQNDKHAIQSLFDRIGEFGRQSPYRDREAELLINEQMSRQEGSAYYLSQLVVMQEQALAQAQSQLEALNAQVHQLQVAQQQQAQPQGGFMSRLFGSAPAPQPQMQQPAAPARPMMSQATNQHAASPFSNPHSSPFGQPAQRQGGGFLAGAAQTAVGVAGGMMLGNMLGGMFGGGAAEAAPVADVAQPEPEAPIAEEMPMDDFDIGGFEDGSEW